MFNLFPHNSLRIDFTVACDTVAYRLLTRLVDTVYKLLLRQVRADWLPVQVVDVPAYVTLAMRYSRAAVPFDEPTMLTERRE